MGVLFTKDIYNERAHRKNIRFSPAREEINTVSLKEVTKGVWGMPRLSEATKDVISCDKLWGGANSP